MNEIQLKSGLLRLIGDPHMGRTFENGVPLNRRGDRERDQLRQFKEELLSQADYVVVVGDLFDHPYVSFSVLLDVYTALIAAAGLNPATTYVVMAGNHDQPRNLEAVGVFDVLEVMCEKRLPNLHLISKPQQFGPVVCFPWQWNVRADEQIFRNTETVEAIVGHWDLKVFDGKDSHLAPTKKLQEQFGDVPIFSGHYHVAGAYEVDGVEVTCTGSMQPYSHGEDPDGNIYITLTPAELEDIKPELLRDKCVRVLLKKGEEMPTGIDCLALTPKRLTEEEEGTTLVSLGDFSWNDILLKKIVDLPQEVREFIEERLRA